MPFDTEPPEDSDRWAKFVQRKLLHDGSIDGAALVVGPAGTVAHSAGRLAERLTPEAAGLCLNLFRYNRLPEFDSRVLNCRLSVGNWTYCPHYKSASVVLCSPICQSGGRAEAQLPGGLILARVRPGVLLATFPKRVQPNSAMTTVHSFCQLLP